MVVEPSVHLRVVGRDPADDRVLEAVVAARTDYIVTGDSDLLDLDDSEGLRIVDAARFVGVLS